MKELFFTGYAMGTARVLRFGLLFLFELPFFTQFSKTQVFSRMIQSNQRQDAQDVSLSH